MKPIHYLVIAAIVILWVERLLYEWGILKNYAELSKTVLKEMEKGK